MLFETISSWFSCPFLGQHAFLSEGERQMEKPHEFDMIACEVFQKAHVFMRLHVKL